jgi:hypothetical protein
MLSDWFTTEMSILVPSQERDTGGAILNSLSLNGSVSGHLYSVGAREIDIFEKIEGERYFKFLCPLETEVSEEDILGIDSGGYDFLENQLIDYDFDFKAPAPSGNWTFTAANGIHADNYQNRKDILDFESNTLNTYPALYNNFDLSFDARDIILIRGEFYFPSTNPNIIAPAFRDPDSSYNWVTNEITDQWVIIEFVYTTTASVSGYKITLKFGNNIETESIANGEKIYINKIEAGRAAVKYNQYNIIGLRERLTGDNAHLELHLKQRI